MVTQNGKRIRVAYTVGRKTNSATNAVCLSKTAIFLHEIF